MQQSGVVVPTHCHKPLTVMWSDLRLSRGNSRCRPLLAKPPPKLRCSSLRRSWWPNRGFTRLKLPTVSTRSSTHDATADRPAAQPAHSHTIPSCINRQAAMIQAMLCLGIQSLEHTPQCHLCWLLMVTLQQQAGRTCIIQLPLAAQVQVLQVAEACQWLQAIIGGHGATQDQHLQGWELGQLQQGLISDVPESIQTCTTAVSTSSTVQTYTAGCMHVNWVHRSVKRLSPARPTRMPNTTSAKPPASSYCCSA